MKRLYAILCLGLAFLAASSCVEQEEVQEGPVIAAVDSNLKIPAKGGEATIEFVSELPFTVDVDKDWCDVTVDGMMAIFTAPANESFESRYAKATVRAGNETLSFTIQQFGFYTSGFEPADIKASSEAATFEFRYEYEDEIVAVTDADWITITATDEILSVALAENTEDGTPENPARYAEISWSLGFDKGIIKVTQNNVSFMKVDSNWDVHYDGVMDYDGEDAAYISNDVTDPAISGKYGIYAVRKSEFTASGMDMSDFALVVADAFREEIEAIIGIYASFGYSLSFGDFLYEDSDYEIFNPFDEGDYIAFAIGFTEEGSATGHYAFKDFNVKYEGGGATGYEAWLGEWEVNRGSATDTWKITADQAGSTYTITGIEGMAYPVLASYIASSDQIEVRAQDGLGTYNSSNYGECSIGLYGGWSTSSFATGTYVIFTGKASGNKAELTPGTVSFSDGSSYLLERVQFIATTADDRYLSLSQDRTPLPVTLTRKGSGGDNTGGGTGSDTYKKWIGSWSVDSGAFDITLAQNVADESLLMRGWQFEESFFESSLVTYENGAITIYGDDDTPVASSVDIGVPEGPCDLYYVGFFPKDGKEYYITSGGYGPYDVATGTISADGSAVFTGNAFELQGGAECTFTRYQIIAAPVSDPDGGVYTFNSKPNEFPLTAVKSGTSSFRTMAVQGAGKWVKASVTRIYASELFGRSEMLCSPYLAVPEVPVQLRRHLKTN